MHFTHFILYLDSLNWRVLVVYGQNTTVFRICSFVFVSFIIGLHIICFLIDLFSNTVFKLKNIFPTAKNIVCTFLHSRGHLLLFCDLLL